jgi:nucleotide-binding universal stress UspA family protein
MPDISRILCPVDFSPPSHAALRWSADLSRRYGAPVTLLHAYPVPGYVLPEGFVAAGPDVLAEVEEKTRRALDQWSQEARELGAVTVAIATEMGDAAPEIAAYAKAHGSDLIVMGSHGRTGWKHLLMGSVAAKVVRIATVPVLVVHAGKDDESTERKV